MGKIATEKYASDLAGLNRTYASNTACTRSKAVELGCTVHEDPCANNQLVCEEWLTARAIDNMTGSISNISVGTTNITGYNYSSNSGTINIKPYGGFVQLYAEVSYRTSGTITYDNGETETVSTPSTKYTNIYSDKIEYAAQGTVPCGVTQIGYIKPRGTIQGTTVEGTGYVVVCEPNLYQIDKINYTTNFTPDEISSSGVTNLLFSGTTSFDSFTISYSSKETKDVSLTELQSYYAYSGYDITYQWSSSDVTISNPTSYRCRFTYAGGNNEEISLTRVTSVKLSPNGTYSDFCYHKPNSKTISFTEIFTYPVKNVTVEEVYFNWNMTWTNYPTMNFYIPCYLYGASSKISIDINISEPTIDYIKLSDGTYIYGNDALNYGTYNIVYENNKKVNFVYYQENVNKYTGHWTITINNKIETQNSYSATLDICADYINDSDYNQLFVCLYSAYGYFNPYSLYIGFSDSICEHFQNDFNVYHNRRPVISFNFRSNDYSRYLLTTHNSYSVGDSLTSSEMSKSNYTNIMCVGEDYIYTSTLPIPITTRFKVYDKQSSQMVELTDLYFDLCVINGTIKRIVVFKNTIPDATVSYQSHYIEKPVGYQILFTGSNNIGEDSHTICFSILSSNKSPYSYKSNLTSQEINIWYSAALPSDISGGNGGLITRQTKFTTLLKYITISESSTSITLFTTSTNGTFYLYRLFIVDNSYVYIETEREINIVNGKLEHDVEYPQFDVYGKENHYTISE